MDFKNPTKPKAHKYTIVKCTMENDIVRKESTIAQDLLNHLEEVKAENAGCFTFPHDLLAFKGDDNKVQIHKQGDFFKIRVDAQHTLISPADIDVVVEEPNESCCSKILCRNTFWLLAIVLVTLTIVGTVIDILQDKSPTP